MREKFITISGSEYIIDYDKKTWERKRGEDASIIRSDKGEFIEISFPALRMRDQLNSVYISLVCPPYLKYGPSRYITSTPIVSREILDEI
jgi:hypothetical protein